MGRTEYMGLARVTGVMREAVEAMSLEFRASLEVNILMVDCVSSRTQ